jgi:hypothetical protein
MVFAIVLLMHSMNPIRMRVLDLLLEDGLVCQVLQLWNEGTCSENASVVVAAHVEASSCSFLIVNF